MAKKKAKASSKPEKAESKAKTGSKDWVKYAIGGAAALVIVVFLVVSMGKPASQRLPEAPETPMGAPEQCGDYVCGARESASGSCPTDCQPKVAAPTVPTPSTPSPPDGCGDGICTDAEKFTCDADCEIENLDARPVCEGAGTKYEGWYQNGRILIYTFCGGCVAECKNEGKISEGWFSSCDGKQIKRMCG